MMKKCPCEAPSLITVIVRVGAEDSDLLYTMTSVVIRYCRRLWSSMPPSSTFSRTALGMGAWLVRLAQNSVTLVRDQLPANVDVGEHRGPFVLS